jgi:glycosyltransferase involved in cell wall biosynthesis
LNTSLIITTYNNPIALKKVVESLVDQTRLPDEVVIADDGSDERTGSLVNAFSDAAPFPVLHVWQENKGFRAAKIRNEAIKQSKGDYIILLDGDCLVNHYFISDHLSLAEANCFIQGKRMHVRKDAVNFIDHKYVNSPRELLKLALKGTISNVHHLIRITCCPSTKNRRLKGIKSCNMSFFKRDILAVNGFNEDFVGWGNEDSELACRFFHYGLLKKVHQFMAVCFHLWHPSNKPMTNANNKQLLSKALSSKEFFCKNGLVKEN